MANDAERASRWSTAHAGLIVFLADRGIEPVEWQFTGTGRSKRTVAVFDASDPDFVEARDEYHATDCCCRVHLERYRKLLRSMQDAADADDVRLLQKERTEA